MAQTKNITIRREVTVVDAVMLDPLKFKQVL